jgi:hypothetical protein
MIDDPVPFNRGAIRPMQCLSEGWQLIKEQYWLFVGIVFVGSLIAGAGPMGILAGPMMCGMYHCVFQRANNRPVEFGMLFQGFDYFAQCIIPALIMTGIALVTFLTGYLAFVVGMFSMLAAFAPQRGQQQPPVALLGGMLGLYFVFLAFVVIVALILRAMFFFAFPLIMDRGLSGWDAVKLSLRATWANLGGVIGILLLIELLGLACSLLCCVGPILELPVNIAMMAVAYRQVFPQRSGLEHFDRDENLDEPPPIGSTPPPGETGIQSEP